MSEKSVAPESPLPYLGKGTSLPSLKQSRLKPNSVADIKQTLKS